MHELKVIKPLNRHNMTVLPGSTILIGHLGSAKGIVDSGFAEFVEPPKPKAKRAKKQQAKSVSGADALANSGAGD